MTDNMADWGQPRNGIVSDEELLESQNQQRVDSLANKVSRLRGIAIELEADVKESPSFVDSVMSGFGSAEGLLSGTMARFSNMLNRSHNNRRFMCYFIAGLVGLFIIFHYFLSRATAP